MRRVKLEKVTGLVALSYLVIIPVGGFLLYKKLQAVDSDLTIIWEKQAFGPNEDAERVARLNVWDLFR